MILHAPPLLATKKFQLPFNIRPQLDGDRKGWACVIILEKLISCFALLPRRLKNFDHHPMVWVCWMAINGEHMLDGN